MKSPFLSVGFYESNVHVKCLDSDEILHNILSDDNRCGKFSKFILKTNINGSVGCMVAI